MIDKKLIEKYNHTIATIIIMLIAMLVSPETSLYMSGILTGGWLLREGSQAEQRLISKYYGNKRANTKWYLGIIIFFDKRAWENESFYVDMLLPIATANFLNGVYYVLRMW